MAGHTPGYGVEFEFVEDYAAELPDDQLILLRILDTFGFFCFGIK